MYGFCVYKAFLRRSISLYLLNRTNVRDTFNTACIIISKGHKGTVLAASTRAPRQVTPTGPGSPLSSSGCQTSFFRYEAGGAINLQLGKLRMIGRFAFY